MVKMYLTFLIAVPVLLCINSANAALMKTFEDSFNANHVYWDGSSVNMAGSGWDGLMNPPVGGRVEATDGQLKMIIPDGLNVAYSDTAPLLYKSVTGNFEAICKVYEPWIDSTQHVSYCLAAQYPDNSENWVIGMTQPVWDGANLRWMQDGNLSQTTWISPPLPWMKLVRQGNTFIFYCKENAGDAWIEYGRSDVTNAINVYNLGLSIGNWSNNGFEGGFDHFELWQQTEAIIELSQDTYSRNVVSNDTHSFSITIENNGQTAATFSLEYTPVSWLTVTPPAITYLNPGQTVELMMTMDAGGLALQQSLTNEITVVSTGDHDPVLTVTMNVVPPSYGSMRQLNPSSRRSPFIISEIMYHPSDRTDGKDLEFVELFNTEPVDWDISGFRLGGDIDYTFPAGTILPGQSFAVVATEPASMEIEYGLTGIYGPYQRELNNGGGALHLVNKRGGVLLDLEYNDRYPWPESADGLGHSLVLTKPDYGENDPLSWQASTERGGNPGMINSGSDVGVCINEVLANPGSGQSSFIELYNFSAEPVDISGYYLSDNPDVLKFKIPEATTISPGGYMSFSTSDWGNAMYLSPNGERIYLLSADRQRVIDAVTYGVEEQGVSLGHFPNGTYGIRALAVPTPGYANTALYDRDIIINEIMYHPISEDSEDEYLELYNKGSQPVDVSGWKLTSGISYTIPNGTIIPSDGYLVIAADAERLIDRYPNLTTVNTVGGFEEGNLNNRGERIRLSKPVFNTPTNNEFIVVDELIYRDGSDWGKWTDGGGSSLELKDPHSDNSRPDNWAGSDETAKAPWTTFSHTGVLDHGSGWCVSLELMLLDNGECMVDDIVIQKSGESASRVSNGNFESWESGWTIEGNHSESSVESNRGYGGSRGMHVIATGDGDNLPICLRKDLTSRLRANETATISAKARWLCGNRNLLVRLHGNYLEAVGTLDIPDALGTPGEQNSTYTVNCGPVIENTGHCPVLPEPGQAITITARVHDPDAVDSVTLYYRIDPSTSYTYAAMNDSGWAGDVLADDGIYSANIPGKASGTMIAFYVEAEDSAASSALNGFPAGAPALILVGDPLAPGVFGNYKMWVNTANGNYWSNQPKMSNEMIAGTFVYGDFRVVYNAGIRMRGSGWIRPRFSDPFAWIASYVVKIDKADRLMGATSLNLDNLKQQDVWGRGVLDPTFLFERMSFWIGERLGVETCYQRFILLHLNGIKKGVVFTDTQHPNRDYMRCWFPNDNDGHSFEADSWFEYDNDSPSYKKNATLERFTTTGDILKQARYRWNWEKKVAHAADDDYTPLFELIDVMNSDTDYYEKVDALVDWDQWMRGFAVRRGAAADRDGYGYEAGKNAYIYKGHNTKWKCILWDLDLGFGIERNYNAGLFSEISDPVLRNYFFEEPAFRRAYWRALQDLVDGPMAPENFDPVADAYYRAFQDNGIITNNPTAAKNWGSNRRGYILNQLNTVSADFRITTNNGNDFSTSVSPYTFEGTAPVKVDAITVNGLEYPATWIDVTTWSITVELMPDENYLEFKGYGSSGEELSGMNDSIIVIRNGG